MYTNDTGITKRLSAANTDIAQILKGLRLSNPKNVRLSYLNLKTIRDKLENLEDVNVLAVAETKTDSTFPSAQFFLDGYLSLYRLDISCDSDGLLVYVKAIKPTCHFSLSKFQFRLQVLPFEFNLKKEKW